MATRKKSRGPDRVVLRAGPWKGVVNAYDPGAHSPNLLYDAEECYIPDPVNGSGVYVRHGFGALATQMGSGANRTGQCVYLHRRLDGTIDRFLFAGGRMHRWDGASTITDITPAGPTISTTEPIFCATFADQLIVSDGSNRPWRYNPATSTATLIDYDGAGTAWVAQGPPAVYSGKLFFIVKSVAGVASQNTIAWSEEYLPQTGYRQTNYDNAWQLTQTSPDALTCIIAEEGALIYFRAQAIGVITGAVNAAFRSSATRDTLSTTVGTMAPAAVKSVNGTIWFPDIDGRVHRLVVGTGSPEPVWYAMRHVVETEIAFSSNRTNTAAEARVGYHETLELVIFSGLFGREKQMYVFDARTGAYFGQWTVGEPVRINAMGGMVDSSNRSSFVFIGSLVSAGVSFGTNSGYLWREKTQDDTNQWLDQADLTVATYLATSAIIRLGYLSTDPVATIRLDTVTIQALGYPATTRTVRANVTIPESSAATNFTTTVTGLGKISRGVVGLGPNSTGSSVLLAISVMDSINVQFALVGVAVTAIVKPAGPWDY